MKRPDISSNPIDKLPEFAKSRIFLILLGLLIVAVDVWTGPWLQFPVLFIFPIAIAAGNRDRTLSLALSVGLPLARLATMDFVEFGIHPSYLILNTFIRIVVLVLLSFFIFRSAIHAYELSEQVRNFVTICSWSKSVELDGEWLTFEEYLSKRFGITATHGICPREAERLLKELRLPKRQSD